MPEPETSPEAEALLDELSTLADEIDVGKAALDDRYGRRLVVFKRLIDLGVSRQRIAAASRITTMAIGYALGSDRKKAPAKKAPAKKKPARSRRRAT